MPMTSTENLCGIINREIEKMDLARRRPHELYLPIEYIMSNGGKRLRPVLLLMACRLFSQDISPAIKPAIAIEFFHNFTLIHDDIMDKAEMRRGKATVHKKWDENTAILSGDAMAVISFDLISSSNQDIRSLLLAVYNSTALEVCEGQQMDMNFESTPVINEKMYMEMIRLKTSVLIAASLKMGAISGGSTQRDAALLYDAGMDMGLAFQLQDDLLDLYGKENFGKKPGGDILMNKKTFLMVKALEKADEKTAGRINFIMEKEKDPETKVRKIKNIFDDLDIRSTTRKRADFYITRAKEKFDETSPGTERKKELSGLLDAIMKREV
jgi:geranylgeranyl diphosphate synthase, type II